VVEDAKPGGTYVLLLRNSRMKGIKRKVKHWHIDYLLNHMQIEAVYVLPG
jgi:Uri superfamily endonuclease